MGYVQQAHAQFLYEFINEVQYAGFGDGVQGGRRFVGNQEARTREQGHGDEQALTLPATQLVGVGPEDAVGVLAQAYAVEPTVDAGPALPGGGQVGAEELGGLQELAAGAERRVEGGKGFLEDQADLPAAEAAELVFSAGQ